MWGITRFFDDMLNPAWWEGDGTKFDAMIGIMGTSTPSYGGSTFHSRDTLYLAPTPNGRGRHFQISPIGEGQIYGTPGF